MGKLKRFGMFIASWILGVFLVASPAASAAATITVGQTPPPSSAPGLIIASIIGDSLPRYIELYNQNDTPTNIGSWIVAASIHDDAAGGCADSSFSIALPQAWILSKKYLTLENTNTPDPNSLTIPFSVAADAIASCISPKLVSVSLIDNAGKIEQQVVIPAAEWSSATTLVAQHKQRSNAPSSTRNITGTFDTDYKFATSAVALNSDPLYLPPADPAGLQILEILPNARTCAPTETDPTCNDYVKLYNPTDQPINLALYRLRIGSKGQSESITNTFTWGQSLDPAHDELLLPPQQYLTLSQRNDGQPLTITDGGNFVWLEDAYGTAIYNPVIQYPDASSTTKVGQAWAFDGSTWRWTSAPQPGMANYFPTVAPTVDGSSETPTILKPCAADQYRNPATNRCKSIVVATSTLTPCEAGQERNPDTNRCRSVLAATTTLKPCQPGWERNPVTNRCRKATVALGSASTVGAVKDVAAPSVDTTGWFVALLVITLAFGYAVYEWRQDILLAGKHAREHIAIHWLRRNKLQ